MLTHLTYLMLVLDKVKHAFLQRLEMVIFEVFFKEHKD